MHGAQIRGGAAGGRGGQGIARVRCRQADPGRVPGERRRGRIAGPGRARLYPSGGRRGWQRARGDSRRRRVPAMGQAGRLILWTCGRASRPSRNRARSRSPGCSRSARWEKETVPTARLLVHRRRRGGAGQVQQDLRLPLVYALTGASGEGAVDTRPIHQGHGLMRSGERRGAGRGGRRRLGGAGAGDRVGGRRSVAAIAIGHPTAANAADHPAPA